MEKSKRHHTEQAIDRNLDKMLFLAAEQKLLPKIIYDYSFAHQSPFFANQYRDSVKQIYAKQTSKLLKYNEEEAKTHCEKFREKILKLINNQLPIDYLKPVKVNEKYVMTYQGHPLEKVQYPTKPEFSIFRDFSQEKFKKGYENVFDDKLEYKQEQIFKEIKREQKARAKTKPSQSQFTKQVSKKVQEAGSKYVTNILQQQQHALPKLVARVQLDRSRLASPSCKKKPRPLKIADESGLILETMMKIGKYSSSSPIISITKESIIKYCRDFYPRPYRIIDFLEFSDVETYTTFSRVPLKMKMMPNQHVCFMAFMLYDSNNDGYICINDLLRLEEMAKKCPILLLDHEIIKKEAAKVKYETHLTYSDLYRLSEVTETTYFNWLKREKLKVQSPESASYDNELKGYFEHLNKRKIMVHYEAFKKMFENDKPYIWYDVLYRLSGIKYEGLKYQ